MANDPFAPADPPEPAAPAAGDYEAFSEVLSASARGRAFLAEHARRSRSAETRTLVATLSRIEAMVQANAPTAAAAPRGEIAAVIAAIRGARPAIAASPLPARAAKLAQLLDLLERRLAALAEPAGAPEAVTAGPRLAVVPAPAEPELPIPSPNAAQAPQIALAPVRASAAAIPEVNWLDDVTATRAPAERHGAKAAAEFAIAVEATISPVSARQEAPLVAAAVLTVTDAHPVGPAVSRPEPPTDPLSAIRLLSDAERIALFA